MLAIARLGGDTLFANSVEAYNRLSPAMKERLEGLHVLHSSVEQAANNKLAGGITRREPEANIHPLVRVNSHQTKTLVFEQRVWKTYC